MCPIGPMVEENQGVGVNCNPELKIVGGVDVDPCTWLVDTLISAKGQLGKDLHRSRVRLEVSLDSTPKEESWDSPFKKVKSRSEGPAET